MRQPCRQKRRAHFELHARANGANRAASASLCATLRNALCCTYPKERIIPATSRNGECLARRCSKAWPVPFEIDDDEVLRVTSLSEMIITVNAHFYTPRHDFAQASMRAI